jgi:uncharacterized protein
MKKILQRKSKLVVIIVLFLAELLFSFLTNYYFKFFSSINYLIVWLILVIVLFWWGKYRFNDFGFRQTKLKNIFIYTIVIFLFYQLLSSIVLIVDSRPISSGWFFHDSIAAIIFTIVSQVFGNTIIEEISYRGFLFPQLYNRIMAKSEKSKILISLISSQIIFALMHLPNHILNGFSYNNPIIDMLLLFLAGIVFAVAYLKTKNLWYAIIAHTLYNIVAFYNNNVPYSLVLILLSIVIVTIVFPQTCFEQRRRHQSPS